MPETLVSSLIKEPVYFYEREDHDIIVQSSCASFETTKIKSQLQ